MGRKVFGNIIISLRVKRRTQKDAAIHIGQSEQTFSGMLNGYGRRPFSETEKMRLLEFFNFGPIHSAWLFREDEFEPDSDAGEEWPHRRRAGEQNAIRYEVDPNTKQLIGIDRDGKQWLPSRSALVDLEGKEWSPPASNPGNTEMQAELDPTTMRFFYVDCEGREWGFRLESETTDKKKSG